LTDIKSNKKNNNYAYYRDNKFILHTLLIYHEEKQKTRKRTEYNKKCKVLTTEEMEAYRLRHINGLEQKQAAKKMRTSQSTYQRILYSTYKKIADALINGKAIKIIKQ